MTQTDTPPQRQPQEAIGRASVCVPVLSRTGKLAQFLRSVPTWIDTVHVADNGEIDAEREAVYNTDYPFTLDVLDLDYDVGIGQCRAAVATAADAEWIVVCDNDMTLPYNIDILVEILQAAPQLGGVGGILTEHGYIRAGCCNLREEPWWGNGTALVQGIRDSPEIEWIAGHPIARFDKLANAMVVRQAALDDYSWDSALQDKEHLDFFVGHWRETDWQFAVCPEVVVPHDTGTNEAYQEQFRHGNEDRQRRACEMFLKKWDYDRLEWGATRWYGTAERPLPEKAADELSKRVPVKYSALAKDALRTVIAS